jgi:alkylation response protein AidB-like acyl-CoA dehydrogenase
MTQDQDPPIVAAAIALAPAVRAARDEAEQMRQTPPALAAEITRAGIYQMYLPRSAGGPETPPLTAFRVVEALSRIDGSVGWCAMIATSISMSVGRLPADVGRELAGTPADYRGAGSARPGGRAWAVDGGYRVKGRWNFASGIQNARWLYCTCIMMDDETPVLTSAGTPLLRAVWVPRESVTIVDT